MTLLHRMNGNARIQVGAFGYPIFYKSNDIGSVHSERWGNHQSVPIILCSPSTMRGYLIHDKPSTIYAKLGYIVTIDKLQAYFSHFRGFVGGVPVFLKTLAIYDQLKVVLICAKSSIPRVMELCSSRSNRGCMVYSDYIKKYPYLTNSIQNLLLRCIMKQ